MERVGEYIWRPGTDRWEWDDTMFHLLGYTPGQVRPSRALMIAHKHPADRARVEHVVADACSNRLAYTLRHRIVTVTGEVHEVTAIGYPVRGPTPSAPLVLHGYVVLLATHVLSPTTTASTSAAPPLPTVPFARPDTRAVVPWSLDPTHEHDRLLVRATEVLARTTELPADAAAALLAHLANTAAVPLIVIAEQVIAVSLDPDREGLGGFLEGLDVPERP